ATANARFRDEASGYVAGASAFADSARNDYWMHERPLPTLTGGTVRKTVRRFHDAYHAGGGNLELGFVERPWARRLLVQGFVAKYDKELQHNALMTSPYGEVTYGETTYGLTARYEVALGNSVELAALASYSHRVIGLRDLGTHVYSWEGAR